MSNITKPDSTRAVLNELTVDAFTATQDVNQAVRDALKVAEIFSTLHTLPTQIRKEKNAVAAYVWRKGRGELKLSAIADNILAIAPSSRALLKQVEEQKIVLAPSTTVLLEALGMRPHLFDKSKEAIERAKKADPFMVQDTLLSMTKSFVQKTTKREHLYMEAVRDHQLNTYKALLKVTFTDHARSLHNPQLTQFDLFPPPAVGSEPPNLDHLIKQLLNGTDGLQNSLNEMVGKENYLLAVQLMVYPSGVGLHCALMFSSRYGFNQAFITKNLRRKWMENWAGAMLFDTCAQGSPFRFRGMDSEKAKHEPLTTRIANITTYFTSSIEVVACGWSSLHREKFLVGPFVRTQPAVKVAAYRTSSLQDFQTQLLSVSPDEPAVSGQPIQEPTKSDA